MAQELSIKVQTSQTGEKLYITEKSGAYDANNLSGWGDPNLELNQSCLFIYAKRIVDEENFVECEYITNQFVYDSGASNSDNKIFELGQDEDGQFNITVFRVPVSEDGTTTLEGDDITEGMVVYHESVLKTMVNTSLVPVTDISELVDDEAILQVSEEVLVLTKAEIKKSKKFLKFTEVRNENVEDIDPYQDELDDLNFWITQATYQFVSNLKVAARESVKNLHQIHQ